MLKNLSIKNYALIEDLNVDFNNGLTIITGETGAGTEISGNAYARTGVTFGAASGGSATNSANVTFPTATGTWGTVSHAGVFDGTDMVFYGALSVSKSPTSGDTFQINAGQLTITLD